MAEKRAYDLMVLIDAAVAEDQRNAIVEELRQQIAGGGELKGDVEWGVRRLAYEIDHRPEAYYHLFQFEAPTELLNQLEHNLSINDQVLRHRVIRLPKGAPDQPPRPEAAPPRSADPGDQGDERGGRRRPPAEGEPRPEPSGGAEAQPEQGSAEAGPQPEQPAADPGSEPEQASGDADSPPEQPSGDAGPSPKQPSPTES